uniref:C-type lectin domain-containing protein n=1 Tax=Panagrolaimus sp. JU765 TaxID=591449 RepID=A0AC34PWV6_9BILA
MASFADAQYQCQQQGGNLVDIDSQFTNMMLKTKAKERNWENFWIGATLTKVYNDAGMVKIWIWEGLRKLVDFNDWAFNEPSNKGGCAAVKADDGYWFAEDCETKKNYICSTPMIIDVCDNEWTYFPTTRKCYKVYYHSDWTTAENNCVAQGAHLVSIHSKKEDLFVQDLSHYGATQSKSTIIGLYTTTNDNSRWNWSDGSSTNFVPWPPGEPNNPGKEKCGSIFTDQSNDNPNGFAGFWNNIPCDYQERDYVCMKASVQVQIK